MRQITLNGVFNARSVGAAGSDWLYRSASLDTLDQTGHEQLQDLGIGLVIDLREEIERADPQHGLPVIHVPIYQAPDGPPQTGSIDTIYRHLLDDRGGQLAAAVAAIARSDSRVLVHCTAGKDRTGLVIALALDAVGFSSEAIIDDYARSGQDVLRHRGETTATALAALELSEQDYRDSLELHLESPASALRGALDHLAAHYGGARAYLLQHGLSRDELRMLDARLGAPTHD